MGQKASFNEMMTLMYNKYRPVYNVAHLYETVRLFRAGVRDSRLPDIAITLIDTYGYDWRQ